MQDEQQQHTTDRDELINELWAKYGGGVAPVAEGEAPPSPSSAPTPPSLASEDLTEDAPSPDVVEVTPDEFLDRLWEKYAGGETDTSPSVRVDSSPQEEVPTSPPELLPLTDLPKEDGTHTFVDKAKAVGAAFVEGVAFGSDLFSIDDEVDLHPYIDGSARLLGEIVRMIGEAYAAGRIVSITGRALMAVPWIHRVVNGAQTADKLRQQSTILQRLSGQGRRGLALLTREAAEGAVFTGIEYALAPEERKIGRAHV